MTRPRRPSAPREFCTPGTFGQLHPAEARRWRKPEPGDGLWLGNLHGAVYQNVVAFRLRDQKNLFGHPQAWLAMHDPRELNDRHWERMLNGYKWLHPADIAVLMKTLPDVLPSPDLYALFAGVADGSRPRPKNWNFSDC